MNYIELFAGCGGLSLGLESEGFNLLFANELSPMAAETYAANHLGAELSEGIAEANNVLWISSQHPREATRARLEENPQEASGNNGDLENLVNAADLLDRKLLVGSVLDLNAKLAAIDLGRAICETVPGGSLDVVSGGPPCQSFSMAGLRQHNNERNSLPWAFAEFVRNAQPKIAVLENVSGILRAFNVDGERYHAWYEVAKAFAVERYVPLCLHINAKFVGAAQNRPRFIMLAFRRDLVDQLIEKLPELTGAAMVQARDFHDRLQKDESLTPKLDFHDAHCATTLAGIFSESPLSQMVSNMISDSFIGVREAIDDLEPGGSTRSKYVELINSELLMPASYLERANSRLGNVHQHDRRQNSAKVQSRFRLYQLLRDLSASEPDSVRSISAFLRSGDEALLTKKCLVSLSKAGSWKPSSGGHDIERISEDRLKSELRRLKTKKQTQRALLPDVPAPAALSIPDDACHYRDGVTRTLTVREMARIQSFPDWFVFRSKITTGGHMRKFQVPQYTQVGNAVPPLLGKAIGKTCREFIDLIDD